MRSCNDSIRLKVRFFCGLFVCAFLALGARLYFVQIYRHDYYYTEARNKYVTTKTTQGQRGEIFDVDGNLLVGNMPCRDIVATPCNIPEEQDQALSQLLATQLKLDYQEVFGKLSRKKREVAKKDGEGNPTGEMEERPNQYALIARNVPLGEANTLRDAIREQKFKGISFQESTMRYYPKGRLLSNVLGFTSMDQDKVIAVMGLERFLDQDISATSGKTVYERDRRGAPLSDTPLNTTAVRDGLNIYLTISEPIQAILEEELDKAYAEWNPKAVYAVMADPYTGNILAMAQRPSFDPNDRSGITPDAYRVRITEDVFEPGSIMKAVTVAGALDYGIITPHTRIDCESNGVWYYNNKRLSDTHGYGMQDATGVIRKSSNIGTAKIALMMGDARLERTLRKFGFGSRTGLPLKPETRGIFPTLERWDGLSATRFSIGYGVAVSPVQMLRAYCALANHGLLPQLRLVDRVENVDTNKVIPNSLQPPIPLFRRPETAREIAEMLTAVTQEGGTALRAAIPGYRVAGKTGTARKVVDGHYVMKYYGSFIGFVPAENPAFVLLVTMDEPSGRSYYGGTVSGPTWKNIAERTLRYMDVKPTEELPEKKSRR